MYQQEEMVAGNYTSFCKDKDGFLWIGTDFGLLRFDGNSSDVFRYDELDEHSISDNRVLRLFCDSHGGMWIGTVDGLNYFDRQSYTFRRIPLPGLKLHGFISDIEEMEDGRIFFVVAGVGLFSVSRNHGSDDFKVEREFRNVDEKRDVGSMVDMGDEGLYLTGMGSRLYHITRYGDMKVECQFARNAIRIDCEGGHNILIATKYEVYRYNTDTHELKQLTIANGENIEVLDMHTTGDGLTYLATSHAGLWEVKGGSNVVERSERLYSSSLELEKLKIGCVYRDDDGNLWLGCNHRGVGFAPAKQMPFLSRKLGRIHRGLEGDIVSMAVAGDKILAGLTGGKLLVMDSWGRYERLVDEFGGNMITGISGTRDNSALVGVARNGIYRLNLNTYSVEKVTDVEVPFAGINMKETSGGDIIASVSGVGVFKLDHETGRKEWFVYGPESSTLNGQYYAGISTTGGNRIWIGGYGGLSCYDETAGTLVSIDQTPFINRTVYSVCDGPDGCVMVATSRGLMRYRPGSGVEQRYTMVDGLPDNDIRTVTRDANGGIWVAGMSGLAYLSPGSDRLQSYSSFLGLSERSYFYSHPLEDGRRMVLGGYEGITMFDLASVPDTGFDGDIKISGLYLNGSRITPEMKTDGSTPIIEGDESSPDALHLSYADKALVINLSTMDFRNTSSIRYEWQIAGDGDIWNSTPRGGNSVYVPSLEPGEYILRMRGWDDNVCSDTRELVLKISKPWYQSNLMYGSLALLVLSIIALFFKVVKSKKEEAMNDAKIKFFMDISHEIRTPIMLLLNPVDALLKQQQTPETTTQLLTVRRNAQRVLGLADQLLDLQKIDKGKMRLLYSWTDLRTFVGELVDMFQSQAKTKDQELTFECREGALYAQVDRDNLDKILVNIISNALKYTPANGKIVVSLSAITESDGRRY